MTTQLSGVPSDMWAVGVILHQLLAGGYPFATAGDLISGQFNELPSWVPKCLKKLVSGLLNPDAGSRLTVAQASKLLNSIVAAIYLPDFWVFDQDEAAEPAEEEEKVIPQPMPKPIPKPAPVVKPEPPVIVKPEPVPAPVKPEAIPKGAPIVKPEPPVIIKPEPVPAPLKPHPSVRPTYK